MDRAISTDVLHFEGFRLDRGGLFRRDQAGLSAPVALGSRALDVLGLLVERHGELISRDAIMEAVWPDTAVEEANLTVQISSLRRILDQNRAQAAAFRRWPDAATASLHRWNGPTRQHRQCMTQRPATASETDPHRTVRRKIKVKPHPINLATFWLHRRGGRSVGYGAVSSLR